MKWKFWLMRTPVTSSQKKKGLVKEWRDAILFAVVFATLIRWSTFEAYAIPSSSMEKSLLTGDYLFVSKLHYGSRAPITPVQVPLTHQTIWGTNIPSFSDIIQLPYYRFPGFSVVKHNDAVVFNHPQEEERPIDLKTYLIKRCIGLPGDTLQIRQKQVFINGKAMENPENLQFSYFIKTDQLLNQHFFEKHTIIDIVATTGGYYIHTLPAKATALKSFDFIKEVKSLEALPGTAEAEVFPHAPEIFPWNKDNFGPLYIPKAGGTISITPTTLSLYKKAILQYEHNPNAEVKDGQLYLNGKATATYTFKQNYYFMMGDNRHNSNDSRYWGFVPEEYIAGKATLVWMSVDSTASFPKNIRWSRLMKTVQ